MGLLSLYRSCFNGVFMLNSSIPDKRDLLTRVFLSLTSIESLVLSGQAKVLSAASYPKAFVEDFLLSSGLRFLSSRA